MTPDTPESPETRPPPVSELRVDGQRLLDQLFALAEIGKTPDGGVHRVAYSEVDLEGRAYAMELMRNAALEVSIDTAGNLRGRRSGHRQDLPPLVFGSHLDSVPNGGRYDGPAGTLAAIEAVQTLADGRVTTQHPLEVVVFQNEEGGLFGSRAMSGELEESELDAVSHSGKTIREGIAFIGGDPARLADARRRRGEIAAFLELHIEQGGVLEAESIDIGVVEGIVGIRWWEVTIGGAANHAGTTPMGQRQDALLAAARFVETVNRVVTRTPGRQVGTVGRLEAFPGAPNVIPGKVIATLELRDLELDKIDQLFKAIRSETDSIARSTGTRFHFEATNVNVPAPTDERVRRLITDAATELELASKLIPSGAAHDAQSMARLAPVGMIFIPSLGGISHSPREQSRPEDVVNGANVLLHTLLKLDEVER